VKSVRFSVGFYTSLSANDFRAAEYTQMNLSLKNHPAVGGILFSFEPAPLGDATGPC
jgi:hypothetical protein